MELLDKYNALQSEMFSYFGLPSYCTKYIVKDFREYYWSVDSMERDVEYADTEDELANKYGNYYRAGIHTLRSTSKWVYAGAEFTLMLVEYYNDFLVLQVFDNKKERQQQVDICRGLK